MTPLDPRERQLSEASRDLAGNEPPTYLDDILRRSARMRQRPAWTSPGRWLPMTLRTIPSSTAPPLRLVWALLLIALLAVVLAAGAVVVGSQINRSIDPDRGPESLAAVALLPTACPAGTILKSGDIATIAGTGVSGDTGDGGPALAATLQSMPGAVAVDAAGAVYFTDTAGRSVRRIGTDGVIRTFASQPDRRPVPEVHDRPRL